MLSTKNTKDHEKENMRGVTWFIDLNNIYGGKCFE